jgi:hypothetical protein
VARIDHLVYGTPDVRRTSDSIGRLLGVTPTLGGRHVGRGTWNTLLSLGAGAYLEIIGPDPEAPEPASPRPFGIDALDEPGLLTWSAQVDDLDRAIADARLRGYDAGPATAMQRDTPDGRTLSWRLTMPPADPALGGVVPFLIDWLATPPHDHPSATSPAGCELASLFVAHPHVERIEKIFTALDLDVDIHHDDAPGVRVVLRTPGGDLVPLP